MSYLLEIEIAGLPKTPNSRMHWASRASENKKWRRRVFIAASPSRPKSPLAKAHITFTRCSSSRPDFDNLAASFKACQDGLQDAGIIANDDHETIGAPTYTWEKAPLKKGKIKIVVKGGMIGHRAHKESSSKP